LPTEEDMSFIEDEPVNHESDNSNSEKENSDNTTKGAADLSGNKTPDHERCNEKSDHQLIDQNDKCVLPERTPEPAKKRRKIVPDDD
jgi:hypothetical protein